MLKTTIKRFWLGFIFEVFATYIITILFSLNIGDGNYYPVASGLMKICKTELGAAVLQFFLAGFLGGVFGSSTMLWEIEKWSLAKQTVCHFFVITIAMLIVAYICNWMSHSVLGFVSWIGMFIVVYIIIWTICYSHFKRKIAQINKEIQKKNQES